MTFRKIHRILCLLVAVTITLAQPSFARPDARVATGLPELALSELNRDLRVGDVVFIHVAPYPFEKVSEATMSWVNHVGIVVDVSGKEAIVAESTFPISRTTPLSRFVRRSTHGRVAVSRLGAPSSDVQAGAIQRASRARLGVLYDTGFDLHSERQYCSRFVREVLGDATGVWVGEVENFGALLARNPDAGLGFWRLWFFGRIPWDRATVTPASLYHSSNLRPVFDGRVGRIDDRPRDDPAIGGSDGTPTARSNRTMMPMSHVGDTDLYDFAIRHRSRI